ncbi:hypothetical protein DL96DRAFT_504601 [Flagelloscypha sp. PMI_526]|nr:hypothetical protein DL96DRAFT_504601 [Flagelloscypha sp. PMI_526]
MTERGGSPTPANQCNVGEVQCCNSVTQADDKSTSHIIKSLNIKDVVGNTAVGLGCSPLSSYSALVVTLVTLNPSAAKTIISTVSSPLDVLRLTSTFKIELLWGAC